MHAYGPAPSIQQRQEVTFFADQNVQVTSSRFVAFNQMYPVNGITSVSPFTVKAKRGWLIFFACLSVMGVIGGIGMAAQGQSPGGVLVWGAILALCIWRAKARVDEHGIFITTAGMQTKALTSKNLAYVQQVLGALHQAVASR